MNLREIKELGLKQVLKKLKKIKKKTLINKPKLAGMLLKIRLITRAMRMQ